MNPSSRSFRLPASFPRALFPLVLIALVLALVASACASPSVAASVNGSDISDEELEESVPLFRFLAELQGAVCGQTGAQPPTGEEAEAACTRQVLGSMIQESILKDYAADHDITVSPDEIDRTISQITQGGSPEQIEAGLQEAGLTTEDLEGLIGRLLLYSSVERARLADEFDEAALRKIYEERKVALTEIRASHILVETKEQARRLMQQANPDNFEELAEEFSGDPGSAENGGDLGLTEAGSFVPEFATAAVEAEPGEIVGPIRSEFGYHVIWLRSKDTPSFEEARVDLVEGSEESAVAFQAWLTDQLAAANVTVNPRYGTWDAELGTVVAVTSTDPGAGTSPDPGGPAPPVEGPAEAPADAPADAPTAP